MKNRKSNPPFGYGPLVLLVVTCVAVVAAIVLTLVTTEDSNIEEINYVESKQSDIEIYEKAETLVSDQGETEVKEEDSVEETLEKPITFSGTYEFTTSDKAYFDDALFIGDSRTVGLKKYGILDNADYFAAAGLNLYTLGRTKVENSEGETIKLEDMLTHNSYGKVYIMLGINELGYNFDTTIQKYGELIDYIFSLQPDAILYVCANMHVNKLRSELDEVHNNPAINRMNEQIAMFADQEKIFYIDINPTFDDEEGNLAQEYISDDTHLMGMYYETWCEWYMQNTIVMQE